VQEGGQGHDLPVGQHGTHLVGEQQLDGLDRLLDQIEVMLEEWEPGEGPGQIG
jgi:hypothetical protein